MDKITRQMILMDINSIDVPSLIGFIENQEIRLEEMIEHGLSADKRKEIDQHFQHQSTKKQDNNKKNETLQGINNGMYTSSEIQRMLILGEITEEDLTNHTILDPLVIQKIRNYQKRETKFYTWTDLPPLQENRTDLYFFGQPGSGKSCILGSLFVYAQRKHMMGENMHNPAGTLYRNQLIEEMNFGILPHSTISDAEQGVNYIPIDLMDPENGKVHPLNFIEMSGELFNRAYEEGISQETLSAKNYLNNNNKKLLFFVIDYDRHQRVQSAAETSQLSMMSAVLEMLDNFGTLEKTDGIFIIVSKSDLFPNSQNRLDYGEKFLWEDYGMFLQNCITKQEKHHNRFQTVYFPYSIGKVELKDILTAINMECPENIFHAVNIHAHYKNNGRFWNLFK